MLHTCRGFTRRPRSWPLTIAAYSCHCLFSMAFSISTSDQASGVEYATWYFIYAVGRVNTPILSNASLIHYSKIHFDSLKPPCTHISKRG